LKHDADLFNREVHICLKKKKRAKKEWMGQGGRPTEEGGGRGEKFLPAGGRLDMRIQAPNLKEREGVNRPPKSKEGGQVQSKGNVRAPTNIKKGEGWNCDMDLVAADRGRTLPGRRRTFKNGAQKQIKRRSAEKKDL